MHFLGELPWEQSYREKSQPRALRWGSESPSPKLPRRTHLRRDLLHRARTWRTSLPFSAPLHPHFTEPGGDEEAEMGSALSPPSAASWLSDMRQLWEET